MISLENISIRRKTSLFGQKLTVLDGVSLRMDLGKFYHVVGILGSGKSSLARVLAGLERPTAGKLSGASKARVGYMPEDLVLPVHRSIEQVLAYCAGLRGVDKNNPDLSKAWSTNILMGRLGIERFRRQRVEKSSVAVRRRLQLAIALVNAPDLVILDEPLYGFDDQTRREVLAMLRELKIAGRTIITASGQLREFSDLADSQIILQNGKVAMVRQPSSDGSDQTPYELELSGINQEMLKQFRSKRQLPDAVAISQSGFQQRMRFVDYESALYWLNAAVTEGIIVTRFEEMDVDLAAKLDALLGDRG